MFPSTESARTFLELFQSRAFVHGNVVGLVALDQILRFILRGSGQQCPGKNTGLLQHPVPCSEPLLFGRVLIWRLF
jgi:hypothetical protein